MTLRSELETVLEMERLGQMKLAEAEEEARRLSEQYRTEARRLREEGEERLARHRRQRWDETEAELERVAEGLRHECDRETFALRRRAEANREAAVDRVLQWLSEEP